MNGHLLEAVPNFSEGRDASVLDAIGSAMGDAGGRVLDVHADADHNRSVFTVAGGPDELVEALAAAHRRGRRAHRPATGTRACIRASARPTWCRSCDSPTATSGRSAPPGCSPGGSR